MDEKTPRCQANEVTLRGTPSRRRYAYGIVGGLGTLSAADVFFKLVRAASAGEFQPEFIFEQHHFAEGDSPGARSASQNGRKLYVFDMIRSFASRQVDALILPCFISHTFIDELQAEVRLPIVNFMEALVDHVRRRHPGAKKLGVLTSDYVRARGLFERYFPAEQWSLVYPRDDVQRAGVMSAIYGAEGIKAGYLQGASVDLLSAARRSSTPIRSMRAMPWLITPARRSDRSRSASSAASVRRRPSIS